MLGDHKRIDDLEDAVEVLYEELKQTKLDLFELLKLFDKHISKDKKENNHE